MFPLSSCTNPYTKASNKAIPTIRQSIKTITVIIFCGLLGVVYGIWASKSVMDADPGNERMREIASAIQEGAGAYLKRQYATISVVGVIIFYF